MLPFTSVSRALHTITTGADGRLILTMLKKLIALTGVLELIIPRLQFYLEQQKFMQNTVLRLR